MFKHNLAMFIYFYIYVSISFFFSPFLISEHNFEWATVGYLTVFGLVCLIISFFINGYIADKIRSNKKIIIINLIISVFAIFGLVYLSNDILISIMYILSFTSFIMITSQLDGLIIRDINPQTYSLVRGFGSVGAAVSYFVNSYALNGLNTSTNLLFNGCLVIALLVIVCLINEREHTKSLSLREYEQEVKNVIKIKPILYILIITFFTYGTLSADDSYQVLYNTQVVNISVTVMGIVGFISICSESAFMFMYSIISEKTNIITCIKISIYTLLFIYITRFTMYSSPLIINIGSILMGVFIGFYVPSAIFIINKYIGAETKSIFLSFYQIMIRFGGILIGLITTIFFDLTGSLQNIYFLHTIMIAISLYFVSKLKIALNGEQDENSNY